MKKHVLAWHTLSASMVGLLALSGCATPDTPYRSRTFAEGRCGTPSKPVAVDAQSVSDTFHGFELAHPSDALECAVQSYNAGHPIAYDIGFVELLDSGETPAFQAQMADLRSYLDAHAEEPLAVYVFVHGWRHNAALGNEDVARFHTILALMKSYWRDAGEPNRRVFGIYVGWRGAAVHEPGWGDKVDQLVAGLTFPGRKEQSDKNAQRLQELLTDLESQLPRSPSRVATPMVVIGHSLGGNMVLRATRPLLEKRLRESPQGAKVSGVGSLVVLLNPASELTQWMALQRASREHADIINPDRDSYLTQEECAKLSPEASTESKRRCPSEGTAWVYPPDQMPVLVSLTASEHFRVIDPAAGDTDNFATNVAFPLAQRVFNWSSKSSDLVALGHALPVRAFGANGRPNHDDPDNRLYGLTHEAEVNDGSSLNATYGEVLKNAQLDKGVCAANQRLIRDAIQEAVAAAVRENSDARGRSWNQENLWLDPHRKNLRLNVKHELVRGHCSASEKSGMNSMCNNIEDGRQIPRLGDIYDPYWNVGVHPNLIESHGRYVSQNLWCFVHGLATP